MAVNVALIGAGYWGANLMRNFANLETCRLATVCDLDAVRLARVAENYPQVQVTTRLADVLENDAITAVAVATPAESHCEVALACLAAGKHVFVEKPLAANSADAASMVAAAEANGRILMVGHIFLYDAAVTRMLELVHDGRIGDVRYLHGVRTSMAGTARLDTNIVWDALSHDAYILPALFGNAPRRVMAAGAGYLSPDLEDVAFVTFDFGDNRLAQIYVSWYALEKARRMTVIGSDAILHYDDLGASQLTLYHRGYEQSAERDPQGRPYWHWRDKGSEPVALQRVEPLRTECRRFIASIVEGTRPLTDGASGLAAVRVLEACQRALQNHNCWVLVD